ncbi:hypothetical protein K469DRAFT_807023 [Zopfia rhizophila CBS 207.26]|uniref:Spherulation-specific family 4 n=1 Tax=Zopfia rhizophila CBS 207.26 TaxID=1314779 RepID=A0A6A6DFD1_9PEZI|nr:hypothetical protein K469DRAFT_807023 [Zopfia rhizophila CBS 207.26]
MLPKTFSFLILLAISNSLVARCRCRRDKKVMDASVLLPLYVYPSTGAWEPVYGMASSYPRVSFTAIVNPHSGPGEGSLPNENYTQAIQTLNSLENLRTIGYVATTWCTKNVSSVLDEVAVYAGWSSHDPSLAMSGIFFDETPWQHTSEYVTYLQTISQAVHGNPGLREGYVVHNPGALLEAQYFGDPNFVGTANLTVVFEDTYANWTIRGDDLTTRTLPYDHESLACMVHSVPTLSNRDTEATLQKMLAVGRSVYLTGANNYTSFDSYFPVFVDCLDGLLS